MNPTPAPAPVSPALLSPASLTPDQLEQFERDGYLIVRGLYSSEETTHIRDSFMQENCNGPVEGLSQIPQSFSKDDPLSFYPRMMHPHKHTDKEVGRVARNFLLDPRLLPILKNLFGEEPIGTQTMFYFKPPGARGQDLHQDNFYLRVRPGTCMAAWLAVDRSDPENGGMSVVPGSHVEPIVCPEKSDSSMSFTTDFVPVPEGREVVHTVLEPGDVLFFGGSLIHGSTPNTSQERFRRSLIAHYVSESALEMSSWYGDLMRFDATPFNIGVTQDGGPCGEVHGPQGSLH